MSEHAAGALEVPAGVERIAGEVRPPAGQVGVVVSRFNGGVTNRLLESALAELDRNGVRRSGVTVLEVPGAFELPGAVARLAVSGRYACLVALGCVIRGETFHFELVAGEAAAGLQAAAVRTGVPVALGVLAVDTAEQAEARVDTGAAAARTALEMADLFGKIETRGGRPSGPGAD